MGQTQDFKCPCCGGYVEFDPASQRFKCLYCGQRLTRDELEQKEAQSVPETRNDQNRYHAYHCKNCGAQIVTGDTTAATRCYYCHNPVVLTDRLEGEFHPDGMIPFALDREGAMNAFRKFIKSKKFVDHRFYSEAQLADFSGVYYPYWLGDVEGQASFSGEGTRVSVMRGAEYTTTTTKHYRVRREGLLSFRHMVRKALSSADRLLAEGIHPYRYDEIRPYEAGYLSGFMAEMRDVNEAGAREDMLRQARESAPNLIRRGHTFQTLNGDCSFRETSANMKYVLLPAWIMTYKGKHDAQYFYMMNGQTGEVCGKLPVDKKKLLICCVGVGTLIAALLCAGGAFLW